MKYQVLFSLKNNEKVFMNVVCCSRDWRFKGKHQIIKSASNFWIINSSEQMYRKSYCTVSGARVGSSVGKMLTLKAPNKNCSRRHFNFLLLSFKENKA